MIWRVVVVALLVALPVLADGPVSVDEAQARLARRMAEREHAATTQPIQWSINQLRAENKQLKARIEQLRAQINRLEAEAGPTSQPAAGPFGRVQVGMTLVELTDFIKAHPDRIRIVRRIVAGRNKEDLAVTYFGIDSLGAWIVPPPGSPDRPGRRPNIDAHTGSGIIHLENGVVSSLSDGPIPPEKEAHDTGG